MIKIKILRFYDTLLIVPIYMFFIIVEDDHVSYFRVSTISPCKRNQTKKQKNLQEIIQLKKNIYALIHFPPRSWPEAMSPLSNCVKGVQ